MGGWVDEWMEDRWKHETLLSIMRMGSLVLCIGLAVLLDAVSWAPSSSEENFSSRGDSSLRVNMGSDSTPQTLFRMRV